MCALCLHRESYLAVTSRPKQLAPRGREIQTYNLTVIWRVILEEDSETHDWAVWCPELKGCVSAGATREEAIENIKEAIVLYLEPLPIEAPPGSVELKVAV
jgi:predicted RNase H-like HicB family nuclease